MKTPLHPRIPLLLLAAGLAPVTPGLLVAAAPATTVPKPYTLFVGVDFDVQQQQQFYRVRDVVGGSFIVDAKGQELHIPMRDWSVRLRIAESLKLADTAVTIADLKSERTYTAAADPVRKWSRETGASDLTADAVHNDEAQQTLSWTLEVANDTTMNGFTRAAAAAQTPGLQGAAVSAAQSYGQAVTAASSDQYDSGASTLKMQEELAKKQFDAMEVSFAVSSPRPLTDAYVVVMARYHDPQQPKDTARNWIYAESLGTVNEQPRRVHVLQGGFPPGFELENVSVHLFDHGRETASNVAARRIELTRDEAFQFMVVDYFSTHKDATLPPSLAMGRLSAAMRAGLSAGELGQTYFVKVNKDGLPRGAFLDEACTRRAGDAALDAVFADCRFRPALVQGRPVDGVARLSLRELPN